MNISEHEGRFIQEATRRGMADSTIEQYVSCLRMFFGQANADHPKNLNEQDIRNYLSKFKEPNTQRSQHSAIKKFYEICLHQKNKFRYLPYAKKNQRTIIILTIEEIQRLADAAKTNLKHYTIILLFYSTGVRIDEILGIKLCDIDRANMVIYVIGKGNKQRAVTMKPKLLFLIEKYYRQYKPTDYLFQGQSGGRYSERSINEFLKKYACIAGIRKKVHAHKLRHCYASHSLEAKENLFVIQTALGHESPITTAKTYLHTSPQIIANAFSPINNIRL